VGSVLYFALPPIHGRGISGKKHGSIFVVKLRGSCNATGYTVQKRKASTRDAYGNTVEVREFNPVDTQAPYRTTYVYDALDNLVQVRDACANTPSLCDAARPGTQRHATTIEYDTFSRKIRATDPDMGTWTYKYDDVGNLVYQKDAKPNVFPNELWFTYDELNRVTLKNYESPSQTDIAFTYDQGTNGLGRVREAHDQAGTVKYEYDPRGNVSKFTRDFSSVGKRFEYEYAYDNFGRLTDIGYPKTASGIPVATVSYQYMTGAVQTPAVQQVSWVSAGGAGGAGGDVVNPVGIPTAKLFDQAYHYHPTTGSISLVDNPINPLANQDYGEVYPGQAGYDALGRLTGAVGPWQPNSLGVSATYAYDAIGNMVTKDQVASYPPASKTLKYEHATSPHAVTKLTTGDGVVKNYAYDANGNLLQRIVGGTMENFEWDQDNRLLRMRQGSSSALREFVYDYTGERVKASSASSGLFYTPSRDFDWDGTGSANLYVFLGATRVATFGLAFSPPPVSGGVSVDWEELGRGLGALGLGLWPFLAMLLGLALTRWWLDPRRAGVPVLAKRAGVGVLVLAVLHATAGPAHAIAPPYAGHWNLTLYYHADYKGSTGVVYDAQRNGQQALDYWPYGAVRGNLNNGYVDVRHKFTGQELDNFLGLYYYGGRWYDPETGRFISPDPFVQAPKNPQSLNRYSYVNNNPTNLVDPSGYFGLLIEGLIRALLNPINTIYTLAKFAILNLPQIQSIRAGIASANNGQGFFRGYSRSAAAQAAGMAAGFLVGGPVGSVLGGFAGAVAGGAAAGLASAAVMGGDLGEGALWGAGTAAALVVLYIVAMQVGAHLASVSGGAPGDMYADAGSVATDAQVVAGENVYGPKEAGILESYPELSGPVEDARITGKAQRLDSDWMKLRQIKNDYDALQAQNASRSWWNPTKYVRSSYIRTHGFHFKPNIRYEHIHFGYRSGPGNTSVPTVHWDPHDPTAWRGFGMIPHSLLDH